MARTHRLWTTAALIICLVGTQWSGTLFASEEEFSGTGSAAALPVDSRANATDLSTVRLFVDEHPRFTLEEAVIRSLNAQSDTFAQRGRYRGRGGRGGRNGGAHAALVLGALASITGAAVLVYA